MEFDAAHLSSLSSALEDLSGRITALANEYQGSPRDDVAGDLFEVERLLVAAHRRLRTLVSKL